MCSSDRCRRFFPLALLGYLNHVDLREKADLQEKEALEVLDSGKGTAVTTTSLLASLSKPDQIPLFYTGGTEILADLMQDRKPEMCVPSGGRQSPPPFLPQILIEDLL